MTIIDRLENIIKQRGIMQKTIAELLEITPSTVNGWFKARNTSIPSAYIMPLCEFLSITPEYLLVGDDHLKTYDASRSQDNLTDNETKLLTIFRALDEDSQFEVIHAAIQEKRKLAAQGIDTSAAREA